MAPAPPTYSPSRRANWPPSVLIVVWYVPPEPKTIGKGMAVAVFLRVAQHVIDTVIAVGLVGAAWRAGRHTQRRLPPQNGQSIAQRGPVVQVARLRLMEIGRVDVVLVPVERTAAACRVGAQDPTGRATPRAAGDVSPRDKSRKMLRIWDVGAGRWASISI